MLSPLRALKQIAVTLVLFVFLYGSAVAAIHASLNKHWLVGVIVTVFYGLGIIWGLQELRSKEAQEFPVYKGLAIFLMIMVVGAAVAASISNLLELLGWATYVPGAKHHYLEFNAYYLWTFLNMLPGIEATSSLGLAAPLQPQGIVAGLPVVIFRAFVIFGLLSSLKIWWEARQQTQTQEPAKKAILE